MDDRLIVALDTSDRDHALQLAGQLQPVVGIFKVGLQLFTAHGPRIVEDLAKLGASIFLDLKLHDIPNTVGGAISSLGSLPGVRFMTIHTAGGRSMMTAAAKAAAQLHGSTPLTILGVTVLTSLSADELAETGVPKAPDAQVEHLCRLALDSGVNGLVCSPLEVARLRELAGPEAALVTPGVRPAGSDTGDQKRIATPAAALAAGASHLVIGRPITAADDPAAAARGIAASLPASQP